jgi:1,4-alpha-glucan branching enzyme
MVVELVAFPAPVPLLTQVMAKKINSISGGPGRKQTFTLNAPGAVSVQLMGDFTQWQNRPISMKKGAQGVWRATVELAPGMHHYRFFADGEWHDDPEVPS